MLNIWTEREVRMRVCQIIG